MEFEWQAIQVVCSLIEVLAKGQTQVYSPMHHMHTHTHTRTHTCTHTHTRTHTRTHTHTHTTHTHTHARTHARTHTHTTHTHTHTHAHTHARTHTLAMISFIALDCVATVIGYHTCTRTVCRGRERSVHASTTGQDEECGGQQ